MDETFSKKLVNFLISAGIFILEMVKVAVLAGITIALIRYYLFKPFYVKGASMEPNFHEKEYLIIDELSYRFREPVRGEVIVFRYPEDPKEYFLKRVIGLSGETVKVQGGKVFVYNNENIEGFELNEEYLPKDLNTEGDHTFKIGDNQIFVLGDNRPNSFDSRRFGPIDKSLVVGRAWLRGWPLNRLAIFSKS
ncbi:MAG: signal peptidase I [Candidatus Magasanikbacteria bacterium]|nr:signal peptidase I [Candidatus Magasanikbacteria bacterium]